MKRTYFFISALLFAFVAAVHVLRAIYGLAVQVGDFDFPVWASWPAALVAAVLRVWGFRLHLESGAQLNPL